MINDLSPGADGGAKADGHDLRLRESPTDGVFCEGLRHVQVDSLQAVFAIIAAGNSVRHVAGTNVNSRSSRSCAAFGARSASLRVGLASDWQLSPRCARPRLACRSHLMLTRRRPPCLFCWRSHTLLMMQLTQPSAPPDDEQGGGGGGGGKKTKKQREKEKEQQLLLHQPAAPTATTTISTLQSKLWLVDLAGSERATASEGLDNEASLAEEGKRINLSLT